MIGEVGVGMVNVQQYEKQSYAKQNELPTRVPITPPLRNIGLVDHKVSFSFSFPFLRLCYIIYVFGILMQLKRGMSL